MDSAISYQRIQFRDLDAERFKQVLDRANLEQMMLRGERRGDAVVEQFHGQCFSIDHGSYGFPVLARGQFAPGSLCIGMAEGMRVPTWINGEAVGRGVLQLYSENSDLLYRAGPEATWVGLTVTREDLQAAALQHLGRDLPLSVHGAENLRVDSTSFVRLERLIRSLRPRSGMVSRKPERLGGLIFGAYVEAIASADASMTGLIRQRAAYRLDVVRRADAAMRCLIGTPYSSTRLCKGLGMSERNLELHFREALGVSPKSWFQHLALHRARAQLLRKAPQRGLVTDVALDCGFEHFGRFSESYRDLFGELPSETPKHLRAPYSDSPVR